MRDASRAWPRRTYGCGCGCGCMPHHTPHTATHMTHLWHVAGMACLWVVHANAALAGDASPTLSALKLAQQHTY
eukprot:scaffold9484_cov124-Isochrysis_galbana.AAC.12